MSWVEEQIHQRRVHDQRAMEEAMAGMASLTLGQGGKLFHSSAYAMQQHAINDILDYFGKPHVEDTHRSLGLKKELELVLRPYGMQYREVRLSRGWHKKAMGPMIGWPEEGAGPVALLPKPLGGYWYRDEDGRRITVTGRKAAAIRESAMVIYRGFPTRSMKTADLWHFVAKCLNAADFILVATLSILAAGAGMLVPRLVAFLTGFVRIGGSTQLLWGTALFLLCAYLSSQFLSVMRDAIVCRMQTKTSLFVDAAMMMRILSLPARFFKDYGSGDLASRATMLGSFCELVFHNLFSVGMTSLASLAYLSVIFDLTPSLAVPALVFLCIKAAVFMATAYVQMGIKHREKRCSTRENGVAYALLSGITKIRLAGAEKRAFVKWANAYGELGAAKYNPSWFIQVNNAILLAVSLAASGVYMTIAVRSGISASHFLAFMAADGVLSGAFASLSSVGDALAELAPIMEMIRPILQTAPEASENRELVGRLSGRIELSNVSFCYRERSGFHINELNLKIDPGEYVAIVGRSGSGKSTLIRLLLGFEAQQMGAIYYDGKDINNLELRSLRRHIGVVTQDGGLFEGSIFENIAISNPDMGLEEAWEAAELAGIADDIRQMPMGMNTVLSEGRGGISGGQKQRIMIARAVASRPKILMFDEATSALDNLTQKMVADALDHLNCTRIVIAHRLSTIRHCDRILVMEEGHLIEEGSYEELIAADGVFAGLIARQQLGGRDAQVGKMMLY